MKKKSMILILGALLALGGCSSTDSNNGTNEKEVVLSGITLSETALSLAITGKTPTPTATLTVTVDPTGYSLTGLSFASSDPAVATVDNTGKVTGLKAGTATITATLGGKSATCLVTVTKDPFENIIEKEVGDFEKEDLNQNLYRVSGVVQNINDISNSFRLYDSKGTGTYLTVTKVGYESAREDDFTFTDDLITYNSPDVFANLDIEEGCYVTLVGIDYKYAGSYQFEGYLDDINDGKAIEYTPTVTVNDSSFGTASLSVEKGTYGTSVEVLATPNDGYDISLITYNDTPLTKNDSGKYVFTITASNFVAVTFAEATTKTLTFDFTATGAAASTSQYVGSQNNGSVAVTVQEYNAGKNYLRLNRETNVESGSEGNGNSLDTIADLGGNISKVVVSAYSNKANGTLMAVYGTNDAYSENSTTERTWTKIQNSTVVGAQGNNGEALLANYEVELTTAYKYIRIQNIESTTAAAQLRITSVTIYYK